MDIGSAKITKDEMQGVKHYLIDVLDPKDEFSAALFKDMAKNAAEEIYDNGHIPIVVGGTGFYIQGLLYDIDFKGNPVNEEYRSYLLDYADKNGNEALHDILKKIDPEAAKQIHPNNVKRVMRALEFNKDTGKKISEHNDEQHERSSPYDFCYFVLTDERETLYRRIDERVDNMMSEGLTDEVRQLLDMGCTKDMVSMQALGYRQLIPYIESQKHEGELAKAIRDIKEETRHFAKRQLTWFRREKDVIWIDKNEFDHDYTKILDFMEKKMKERGLL
jgi:tRNA dimethylallyltransferase